jgi:glutathione peroxidase-family protein
MKYILLVFLLYTGQSFAQTSIYNLSYQTTTGKVLALSDYKGKKLLIATCSSSSLLKLNSINYWDSLKATNPNLNILIIPAIDIIDISDTSNFQSALKSTSSKVAFARLSLVRKDNGPNQHMILQWLTHKEQNLHFDEDVDSDNQLFLISESGVLYAVLGKGVPQNILANVLMQKDVTQ